VICVYALAQNNHENADNNDREQDGCDGVNQDELLWDVHSN
jgi:hypothetical protein